jgi:hypothetical protein
MEGAVSYGKAKFVVTGVPVTVSDDRKRKLVMELGKFTRNLLDSLYRTEETGEICLKEARYLDRRPPVIQGIVILPSVCRMGEEERAEIAADFYAIVGEHLGRRAIADCIIHCGAEAQTP